MKTPGLVFAIVLLALTSLLSLVPLPAGPDGVPVVVVRLAQGLGVLGLVAAAGLWCGQGWAKGLAVAVTLLNGLSAAPGLFFAPSTTLRVLATLGVVSAVLIIGLLVRRPVRQPLA